MPRLPLTRSAVGALLVIVLFIRNVCGKLDVFHRAFDQILVFIGSAFKHSLEIECVNAHPEYSYLTAQLFRGADFLCRSFCNRTIS